MRKTEKMAALALTIAIAVGGVTSTYATGATGETSAEASRDAKSVRDTNMLLTGAVKVTTLSITIPTIVSLNVDITKVPDSEAGGDATKTVNVQVKQPDDTIYRITSNPAPSVWIYVAGVAPEANGGGLPVLTNAYTGAKTKDNNILSAVKDSVENLPKAGAYDGTAKPGPDEIGAPGYWVTTAVNNAGKYYLNSTTRGELIAKDLTVDIKVGKNETPLTIYAFTREDWRAGDKFNVTPAFTASIADPTA